MFKRFSSSENNLIEVAAKEGRGVKNAYNDSIIGL